MRKRDPRHEEQLNALVAASPEECKRRFAITEYRDPEYVTSEVLASLIRVRFGKTTGVLDAATAALHGRVARLVKVRVLSNEHWRVLSKRDSELMAESAQYFWEKFLKDKSPVCNAEVRFAVYLQNRVDDYMRHMLTEENTRPSLEELTATNEDEETVPLIDTVEDPNGESTEDAAIRAQESSNVMKALMAMSKHERHAFYFRVECEYDWKTVAGFLRCSVPTARAYFHNAMRKLQGVCDA